MRQASSRGDTKCIKQLMEQGVSVNVPDKAGFSAFKYACGGGHLDAVRLMVQSADLNDADGRTTALIAATRNGHAPVVRFLLEEGADVESRDDGGNTALLIACAGGYVDCARALLLEEKKGGRRGGGADPNAANAVGNAGLHLCARDGREEIASLLLDRGAEAGAKNASGMTPMEIAKARRHQGVVEVLSEVNFD
uniref:Uncharacterized protein n=1 Tax=Pseudictyota dubia TaxID=2749911 RepID=A0A7R9VLG3_9STRA|mmetsp:Transcript_17939/g.33398  ORF Transcript_17939/g.33398 Transcript_17939/m.33398 type:complete len:195 (+) Transcript_17939:915-1499(+)